MFKSLSGKDKLSVRVAAELEKSILNQHFMPDQPIPSEAKLCAQFNVSRTVVREAIQQLKSQGIIHSIPGSGNYISRNDKSDLKRSISLFASLNQDTPIYLEILELRELLEGECIRKVCNMDSTELVKLLNERIMGMQNHANDLDEIVKIDHDFHLQIIKASGNELFHTILESLYESFSKIAIKVYNSRDVLEQICEEHKQITNAIAEGDAELANNLLLKHINQSKRNI